jgi:putative transposase
MKCNEWAGKIKEDTGRILRKLCEHKGLEILDLNACSDHIHMLFSIPPKLSVSKFIGYLKGKSSLMIFDRHANLKYKYGYRNFGVIKLTQSEEIRR